MLAVVDGIEIGLRLPEQPAPSAVGHFCLPL